MQVLIPFSTQSALDTASCTACRSGQLAAASSVPPLACADVYLECVRTHDGKRSYPGFKVVRYIFHRFLLVRPQIVTKLRETLQTPKSTP